MLNYPAYLRLRASKNAADRTLVMKSFWENQKKYENTLAILQDGAIKQHLFNAQIRNYPDCLAARLFGEDISPEVYQQLIRQVHAYLPALQRYLALKQKMLDLPKFRYEDVYASAVQAVDKTYSFDEARRGHRSGAQAPGQGLRRRPAAAPSTTAGWTSTPTKARRAAPTPEASTASTPISSSTTTATTTPSPPLAHELGHAMHSYFSDQTQPFATSNYTTFLAEIASTFNEHLLMHHLLKNEKDDLFKLYILDNYLDGFRGTLFRQTLFAEFELAMHNRVEAGADADRRLAQPAIPGADPPVLRPRQGRLPGRRLHPGRVERHPPLLPELLRVPVQHRHHRLAWR